ncbi:MAG TPA: putative baseplate assembly protein [Pyrinomonadaceae bacterium]|nr:putative baseplate assembly protein [Pyrinomonadaceae bacterium]
MIRHSQCGCGPGNTPCGCCEGVEALTPLLVTNRPGRNALAYRVGTQATFLETMLARLSTLCLGSEDECRKNEGLRPLLSLSTRDTADPSIALLDAWATVADVLTFYQERIANEGYLRTATERRSIIELARLVGYKLRPGVAASVYLALTIEKNEKVVVEPFQVRAQSVPGPGELPQSFENVEEFEARGTWNKLVPRQTRPLNLARLANSARENRAPELYFKGTTTGLNPGDLLLMTVGSTPMPLRVVEVSADAAADRTQVVVMPWLATGIPHAPTREALKTIVTGFESPGAAEVHLRALSDELNAGRSDAELADFVARETLPGLARITARRNISRAFRDRVGVLSEQLGQTLTSLQESGAGATSGVAASSQVERATLPGAPGKEAEDRMLRQVVDGLTKEASVPSRNQLRLGRDRVSAFRPHSDLGVQALGVFQPALLESLPVALTTTPATRAVQPEVYAFRVKSAPFGHNAPLRSTITEVAGNAKKSTVDFNEWTTNDVHATEDFVSPTGSTDPAEICSVIYLDGGFDKILPASWVAVDTGAINPDDIRELQLASHPLLLARASKADSISRGAYGLSGKTTRIELSAASGVGLAPWLKIVNADPEDNEFQVIRRTVVYAQAELLPLAEEPIEEDICKQEKKELWIVLDGVYSELKSGRWVMIEGARTDVLDGFGEPVSGVKGIELAMLAEVVHDFDPEIPGDTAHTRIKFDTDLKYCYARNQVTIYANVVRATHGETRQETLGSGDGSKTLQQFALKQPPLTYVSAPTPSGVESTLKVFVDDVEWHEAESIFGLQPTARRFVTTRSDAEVTTVIFGNGKQGARLPTGLENVRAKYRQGLGKAGNVAAGKITLLAARPLNVKEVINPRKASGGADPETRDQARRNAPLAVLALDRLVSISDYADFARTFGGVGKAFSIRLSDGIRELVHVTIAGADDIPIAADSDVLRNLRLALNQFGDPALPVSVAVRELQLLVISAGVALLPDYVWEKVAPQIRAKLLKTFSFEARELGQDVFLSEVISAMQSVRGVAYVDVDAFGGIADRNADGSVRTPNELIEASQLIVKQSKPDQRVVVDLPRLPETSTDLIRPAQLAYLVPEVPDTLIINLIE